MAKATGGRSAKKRMQRTETVSIRLDPRLNYLCELAARSQRRTKSSFIEAAIAEKIDDMQIQNWRDTESTLSLGDRADYLWHVRESERVVSLGLAAPHFMTIEEQEIWAVICENGYFWRGQWLPDGSKQEWRWECRERSVIRERIAENWDAICAVAAGEAEHATLPTVGSPPPDDDSDIPF